jgi:hypothetical protein
MPEVPDDPAVPFKPFCPEEPLVPLDPPVPELPFCPLVPDEPEIPAVPEDVALYCNIALSNFSRATVRQSSVFIPD